MKKTIIIIFLLLSGISMIYGQTSTEKKRSISYYHSVDVGLEIGCFKGYSQYQTYPWGLSIKETHAIQFNPHIVFGLNIGFEYANLNDYDLYSLFACLDFRYIMLKNTKWSPLLMCNFGAGGGFEGLKSQRPDYGIKGCNSVFELKSALYLGANYEYKPMKSLYMAVGYEIDWGCLVFKVGTRL